MFVVNVLVHKITSLLKLGGTTGFFFRKMHGFLNLKDSLY